MSQYDLQTLLRGRRIPPQGHPRIPTPQAMEGVHDIAMRHMDTLCEVMRQSRTDDGFGGSLISNTLAGVYPCNVQRVIQSPTEGSGAGGNVENEVIYDVALPPYADIRDSDRLAIPGYFNEWKPATACVIEDKAIPTHVDTGSGWYYECVHAGTTGAVEPQWPTEPNATVGDDSVVWQNKGAVSFLEVIGADRAQSTPAQLVVRAKEWA